MRAPDRFEFNVQTSNQREAMIGASKVLMKGRNKILSAALTVTLTVLAGLGGMALVFAASTYFDFDGTWWALVGWFVGGGLYLASFQLLYSEMARVTTNKPLNQAPQALTFDDTGVTYEATPALWKTPWSMIDDVVETKKTITLIVAGIALSLPKDAVGDAQAAKTLIADLRAQLNHA